MKRNTEKEVKTIPLILIVDSRIEIEQQSDIIIADYSFDECSFFKDDDDDDMCA